MTKSAFLKIKAGLDDLACPNTAPELIGQELMGPVPTINISSAATEVSAMRFNASSSPEVRKNPLQFAPGVAVRATMENRMKLDDAVIVWTPGTDLCRAALRGFQRTEGDRWMPASLFGEWGEYEHKKQSPATKLLAMFVLFNTIVVRDRVSVASAHNAFLQIEEYTQVISPDAPGAKGVQ